VVDDLNYDSLDRVFLPKVRVKSGQHALKLRKKVINIGCSEDSSFGVQFTSRFLTHGWPDLTSFRSTLDDKVLVLGGSGRNARGFVGSEVRAF
jgi:hypothetical protein